MRGSLEVAVQPVAVSRPLLEHTALVGPFGLAAAVTAVAEEAARTPARQQLGVVAVWVRLVEGTRGSSWVVARQAQAVVVGSGLAGRLEQELRMSRRESPGWWGRRAGVGVATGK